MQSFDELLQKELSRPMELKKNGVIVGHITPLEAMVKSLVTKAGKGDPAAISTVRNMTRQQTGNEDQEAERRKEMVQKFYESLTKQFKNEGVYDGQNEELQILAETRYMLDVLSQRIQAADFEPIITEYTSNGGTKTIANPLIQIREKQEEKFKSDIERLRRDAIKRKIQKNQLRRM